MPRQCMIPQFFDHAPNYVLNGKKYQAAGLLFRWQLRSDTYKLTRDDGCMVHVCVYVMQSEDDIELEFLYGIFWHN